MNCRTASVAAVLALLVAYPAHAVVHGVRAVQHDPGNVLPGFVANDILLDYDEIFRGQQMILELTEGSIFQHELGGNTAPPAALFDVAPDLAFDSFVTVGGLTQADSAGVFILPGAVDLRPGKRDLTFNSQGIDIAWGATSGIHIPSSIDFLTSRITLSNNAQGTLRYFGSTSDAHEWIGEATIAGGVIGSFARTNPGSVAPLPPATIPNPTPVISDPPIIPEAPIISDPPVSEPPAVPDPPIVSGPVAPSAGTLGISNVRVLQTQPSPSLSGFVTNDVRLDFDEIIRGQQMILELTQGSIFQHDLGGNLAPPQALVDLEPELAFDTFVSVGGVNAADSAGVFVAGSAVDLQSGSKTQFDFEGLNIAWAPAPGVHIPAGTDFLTSRITLSDDAQGTLRYFGSTSTGFEWFGEATIAGGVVGSLAQFDPTPPAPVEPPPPDPVPPVEPAPPPPAPGEPVDDPIVPEPDPVVIEPSPIEPFPITDPIIFHPPDLLVLRPIMWIGEGSPGQPVILWTREAVDALEAIAIDVDVSGVMRIDVAAGEVVYVSNGEEFDANRLRTFAAGNFAVADRLATLATASGYDLLASAAALRASVPEPASIALAMLAFLAWFGFSGRGRSR